MESLIRLSNYIKPSKSKERFETILEPMQALIQLSLLSYCPVGSKLSISKNLLVIQSSSWNQSIIRSYNSDTRDDIFFLFSVIKRFNKFYSFMVKLNGYHKDFFEKMINLSNKGIDKLLLTYATTDQHQLLHTLRIYKLLLLKPDAFDDESDINLKISENISKNDSVSKHDSVNKHDGANKNEKANDNSKQSIIGTASMSLFNSQSDLNVKDNIDEIFIKITKVYSHNHYQMLNNIFDILENDRNNYEIYIEGITTIMNPVNEKIKKWINENIIF
tara:strand:+ start:107 stop:931 length:825 start_codon:yes stop_codon:yes gene_type:complete